MNFKINYTKKTCVYLLAACITLAATTIYSSYIEVTSEADSGPGTLRQAIIDANSFGNSIAFSSNVKLIKLLSPLPIMTNNYTIDGSAHLQGSEVISIDCDDFPSPVCDPEGFSGLLRVTIDGSSIPSTEPFSGFGLRSTTDSIIIGLKIQNFTGSADYPDAVGIQGGLGTATVTVSCCEVSNILNGPVQINSSSEGITTTGNAIGIDRVNNVQRCLVSNVKTAPISNPQVGASPTILATGNAIGINNFTTADQCNVNHIHGGDIIANNNQSDYEFYLGQTIGFGFGVTDAANTNTISLTASTASNLSGGSIITNYSNSSIAPVSDTNQLENILLYNTCGAYLSNSSANITIDNSALCTIQTGSIKTCSDNIDVITPFAAGIFARGTTTSINNNKVTQISGNHLCLNGMNSTALISSATGIVSSSTESIATSNTISYINAGCSIVDGECAHILAQPLFTYFTDDDFEYVLPPAAGFLSFDDINITSLLVELENNHISEIDGKSHTAREMNASILSAGSVGAATLLTTTSITQNNTIKNITGSKLIASHAALIARNTQASAGLYLLSSTVESNLNTINSVYETSIRTSGSTPTINGFNVNQESEDSQTIFPIFTSGIYIDGLPFQANISSAPQVNTTTNIITNIIGSHTQSNGSKQGSIATGIFFRKPSTLNPIEECSNNKIGVFENNTISNVTGGTNAPGYGIVLNQDFYLDSFDNISLSDVLSNIISNVKGSILTPYTLTQEELIAECIPGSGSEGSTPLTFLPPFPYGPSAGINLFASGCTSVHDNIIKNISSPDNSARGIGSVASSDVEISGNTISTINGPGIFVGGASADASLIAQAGLTNQEFEDTFPSVRNLINSNSTSADMTQGIELGVVDWDNYLISIAGPLLLSETGKVVVVGNHNQTAPCIKKVLCNSNGSTTIEITFSDKNHPNSTFEIQFFRNSTSTIPHGEQAISLFDQTLLFTTNADGAARARFVFVPAHKINNGDTISAHVTLIVDGTIGSNGSEASQDIGDTSEFGVESQSQSILATLSQKPKPFTFNQFLCK